ncbi:MAG TPA: HAMP domain-containing sensor histidine kinase [Gemmatirosa sp.]
MTTTVQRLHAPPIVLPHDPPALQTSRVTHSSTHTASVARRAARPYLPIAAAVFVCVALVALAASPLLTFRRLDALQTESAATTVAAASDLVEVRLLFAEEVARHQMLRAGDDPHAVRRYTELREQQDQLLAHLARLAPHIGPAIPLHVAALRAYARRWHRAPDARAAGEMNDTMFRRALPDVLALRDSTLVAHARLAAEIQRADANLHRDGARAVADQRGLSAGLGALALAAAAAVAGFARRERRLSHALARSVDEEQRLRAEAEARREELVRVAESKARLVRGFTHDVKNPLGAADGYLALLEDGLPDPATPAQHGHLGRARRSVHAALHLIDDLLEVARAEAGVVAVRAVATDLAAVACEAVEEFRAQAERKGLRLDVVLDCDVDDGDAIITSDPVRVRQVLGNLIANAVKYTPRGHVVVRLLGIRAGRGPNLSNRYAIEVSDTGPGIAPAHQARLFDEFVRLAPHKAPGVGLGLAISRRIAQALGGDLAVRSTLGAGSTFVLWLPAARHAPEIGFGAAGADRDAPTA